MTNADLDRTVKAPLHSVAPDLEGEPLDPRLPVSRQFEFDSMDFLNFVIGLNRASGFALPEKDFHRLTTLASTVAYLAGKRAARKSE